MWHLAPRGKVEAVRPIKGLGLEAPEHHFLHILLVKSNPKASWIQWGVGRGQWGESFHFLMEEQQSGVAKSMDLGRWSPVGTSLYSFLHGARHGERQSGVMEREGDLRAGAEL